MTSTGPAGPREESASTLSAPARSVVSSTGLSKLENCPACRMMLGGERRPELEWNSMGTSVATGASESWSPRTATETLAFQICSRGLP